LFAEILKDKLKKQNVSNQSEIDAINRELVKLNQRLSNARVLMLDGEISATEYKEIKIEIENRIANLTRELTKLSSNVLHLDNKINNSVHLLSNLQNFYIQKDTATKQRIIGSIFPEKLIYENSEVRTAKMNKVVSLIFNESTGLGENKKGQNTKKSELSFRVESEGFEP
jgi:site-specific DNA recombinase